MSNAIIEDLVRDVRSQIEDNLIHQKWVENQQDPGETLFAPLDLAETVLRPQLRPLFKAISDDLVVDEDVEAALRPETTVCRILAILTYINYDIANLRAFRTRFVSNLGSVTRDSALPLSKARARELFGVESGERFYRKQFIFCPVILKEGEEVECKEPWCRLPFQQVDDLSSGSSGVVTKVIVPKGHFKSSNSMWGLNPGVCKITSNVQCCFAKL